MDFKGLALDVLVALLVPFLTILAGQLILWIAQQLKKRGLDLSAEQQAKLEALAQKAILAVQEWARSQAKAGIATSGPVKLAMATNLLNEAMPGLSDTQATAAINSQLATLRVASPESIVTVPVDPR